MLTSDGYKIIAFADSAGKYKPGIYIYDIDTCAICEVPLETYEIFAEKAEELMATANMLAPLADDTTASIGFLAKAADNLRDMARMLIGSMPLAIPVRDRETLNVRMCYNKSGLLDSAIINRIKNINNMRF